MITGNQHLTRQMDLIPLDVLDTPITLIGAGAIGSFTALSLVKMGYHNITAIDYDSIDIENMNCQFFRHKDIGKRKVLALQELIEDFTGITINAINDRWSGSQIDGIVICAVDSMEVRKQMFNTHARKAFKTSVIIDPRMGAEEAMMFTYSPVNPKEIDEYSRTLYSDSDAIQERCTAKSTMYCALGLSAIICSTIKEITVNNTRPKSVVYDLKSQDMMTFRNE